MAGALQRILKKIGFGGRKKSGFAANLEGYDLPFKRLLDSKIDDTVFHYCSNETLLSISEHRTIRLSDANMLNDYQEGRWGYSRFEDASTNLIRKNTAGIDVDFCDKVDEVISHLQLYVHPVLCSFSKKPDVLSQWRSYSEDGTGVSVGFDTTLMKKLPMTFLDVEYNKDRQIAEIESSLIAIKGVSLQESDGFGSKFREACTLLATNLYAYKNPAFSEEDEIRGIHLLKVEVSGGNPFLSDGEGLEAGVSSKPVDVKFRCRNGSIIAFVDIPLPKDEGIIKEIWLGPKNDNGLGNIMYPLHQRGFKDFAIKKSAASYR